MFKSHKRHLIAVAVIISLLIQLVSINGSYTALAEEKSGAGTENVKPVILQEEKGLRTENSKTFLRSDGSYQRVSYAEPIHYKSGGTYKNIDNRLEMDKSDSSYVNKKGKYSVHFAKNMESGVTIDEKDSSISFSLVDNGDFRRNSVVNEKKIPKLTKKEKNAVSSEGMSYEDTVSDLTEGKVSYVEETSGTKITYETSADRIKESILFPGKDSVKESYSFQIETASLKAEKKKDGSIILYKKNKSKYEYMIEAPYLFDSGEEAAYSYDVKTTLIKNEKGYMVTYSLPLEWLKDAERTYPVTLDPTVYLDNTSRYMDTYITASSPNTNYKNATVATIEQDGRGGYLFHPFDYPSGDIAITSSKLYFFMNGYPPFDSYQIGAKRVTSSWNSDSVTWNTRPSVENEWIDCNLLGYPGSLDITSVIQDYSKSLHSYGVMLSGVNGEGAKINTGKSSMKPFLVTTYKPLNKEENELNFRSVSCGKAGAVSINEFNGRVKFTAEDIGISGGRLPVSICRVHTANVTANVGFGEAFRTNYHQKLSYNSTYNIFTYIDSEGDIHYLHKEQTGHAASDTEDGEHIEAENTIWKDDLGIGYQLEYPFGVQETQYDKMEMTTSQNEALKFNTSGNLISISNAVKQEKNASVTIAYTSGDLIDKIVDGTGKTYQFKYDASNRVTSICYLGKGTTTLKEVKYAYTTGIESAYTVTYPDGKKSEYNFIYGKFLTAMKNPAGEKIGFVYDYPSDTFGKVESVCEYGKDGTMGDKLSYKYEGYRTTVSDQNGNKEIYEFDNQGRITGVRNKEGKAVLAEYDDKDGSLLGVSDIRFTGYGENLLSSPSYTQISADGTETSCTDVVTLEHDDSIPVLSGKTYSKLPTSIDKIIKQKFTCEGDFKAGMTYSFGGWLKGRFRKDVSSKNVYIQFTAEPVDSTKPKEVFGKSPNNMLSDWQYFLKEYTLKNDCKKISVEVYARNQMNPVYISQIECKQQSLYPAKMEEQKSEATPTVTPTATPTATPTNTTTYDKYGNVISDIRDGVKSTYIYNAYGDIKWEQTFYNNESIALMKTYDEDSLLTEEKDTAGIVTKYGYDNENRVNKVTYQDGIYDEYTYDEDGNKLSHSTHLPGGVLLGENKYSYLDNGLLNKIDSKNGTYQFTYNTFGDILSAGVGNKQLVRYEYKSNSNRVPSKVVYGNETGSGKNTITYGYDSSNRLVSVGDFQYTYDEEENVKKITNEKTNTIKEWDKGVLTVTKLGSKEYTYDSGSNTGVSSFKNSKGEQKVDTSQDGKITVSYADIPRFEQVTQQDKFDRTDNVVVKNLQKAEPEIMKRTFAYQKLSDTRTTPTVSKITSLIGGKEEAETFTYDGRGRIKTIGDGTKEKVSYTYDPQGQLVQEDNSENKYSLRYSYDDKGNILEKKEYEYVNGVATTLKDRKVYLYKDSSWGDLLTQFGDETIRYDSIGNPVDYLGKTLTWENGRQLTSVQEGNTKLSFQYDEDGLRTSKEVGTNVTDYVYTDSRLTAMSNAGNQMVFSYDSEGKPFSMWFNNEYYVFQCNYQGDVVGIVDGNGDKVATYAYDAYGKQISAEPASAVGRANPLRYRGYVYDKETGFYYLNSRYYNPEVGRFVNADAVEYVGASGTVLGYNLFAYCENNPVNMIDSTGYAAINVIFAAVGGIVGWQLGDYVAKKFGYTRGWKYWAIRAGVVIGGAVIGWFSATLMVKILANYLRNNPGTVFRMLKKYGIIKLHSIMQFLGLNPFTLTMDGSKFIEMARRYNNPAVTLSYHWAISLYNRAKVLGYQVMIDDPHGVYGYHIHLFGSHGKLKDLHIQIVKPAWDYLNKIING